MKSKVEKRRILAVERFHDGEKPESICTSQGKYKTWLYKGLSDKRTLIKKNPGAATIPVGPWIIRTGHL